MELEKRLAQLTIEEQKSYLWRIVDKKDKKKRIKDGEYKEACVKLAKICEEEKDYPNAVHLYNKAGLTNEALRIYNEKMQKKEKNKK